MSNSAKSKDDNASTYFDDERISKEINELSEYVSSKIKDYAEGNEVKEILDLLNETSINHRKYEKSEDKADKSSLDQALFAARLAHAKMKKMEESFRARARDALASKGSREAQDLLFASVFGVAFWVFLIWVILHNVTVYLLPVYFNIVDTFFVAFLGALSSSIFLLGDKKKKINAKEILAKLVASPFVAVVLVIVFSELSVGFQGISSTANQTEVVSFTLSGASDGLKMAFAFIFGFFGEASIELLKSSLRLAGETE